MHSGPCLCEEEHSSSPRAENQRALTSSLSLQTTESEPTRSPYRPKFLAKDWASMSEWPASTSLLRACVNDGVPASDGFRGVARRLDAEGGTWAGERAMDTYRGVATRVP
eukprot:scaffold265311_cov33-Tisochrysis_lutea.AAC.2